MAEYLKHKRGFLLVSHDRRLLDCCVDHILSINRADIQVQRGNFSSWYQNKQRQDEWGQSENHRLEQDIVRLSASARRAERWSQQTEKGKYKTAESESGVDRGYVGHKSAKMMKRAKSVAQRRISAMEQKAHLLKNLDTAEELKLFPLTYRTERLAELREVSVLYGEQPVFDPVSFELRRGDRVCLSGKNGCGKSSLLKLLCGIPLAHRGTLTLGAGLTISYVPQTPPVFPAA